jgi:ketosteroid isomerase-like protein
MTHPNAKILEAIYSDLRCIDRYVDDDVVLHPAERSQASDVPPVVGKAAVLAKELALIRVSDDSLVMDVEAIIANDWFGAVTGTLRVAKSGRKIGMPFCGLWRFREGRVVEHWENAYDAGAFGAFLSGQA